MTLWRCMNQPSLLTVFASLLAISGAFKVSKLLETDPAISFHRGLVRCS